MSVLLSRERLGRGAAMIRLAVTSKKIQPTTDLVIRISVTLVAIRMLTLVFDQYIAE